MSNYDVIRADVTKVDEFLISKSNLYPSERELEGEYNAENRFSLRRLEVELLDFKRHINAPPEPYFSLKKEPFGFFFLHIFFQNKHDFQVT